jgi:hypothetical protein
MDQQQRPDWTQPVRNKIGRLTRSPLTKYVLGQVTPRNDFRFLMDNRWIFIAKLSEGTLGKETASLMGSLIVSQFHFAALSRADTEEHNRVPFYFYADEFQSFVTPSFNLMLSEDRKYGLHLTLANQSASQLAEEVRKAIFANVATIVGFQMGFQDRELLAPIFYPYNEQHFRELAHFHAFVNSGEEVFRLKTRKPLKNNNKNKKILEQVSRERYGVPRESTDERLRQCLKDF